MKIHQAQRDAFGAQAQETFPRRVRALLAARMPERRAELEGAEGLARVEAQVVRARARGFTGERSACKFVTLSFVLGEGFAEEPWAVAVLGDARLTTPTERMETLWDAAARRELDEAQTEITKALKG
jgi:hypothetical protein